MDCKEFRERLIESIEDNRESLDVFCVEADTVIDTINVESYDGQWFAIHVTELFSGEEC